MADRRQRAERQHAPTLGRDPVAGTDLAVGREWSDGHPRRPVDADGLDELEPRRSCAPDLLHEHLDATDVARCQHRRTDPPMDLHPGSTKQDDGEPQHDSGGERRSDDVQLDDPEQPTDDHAQHGPDEHRPPLAGEPRGHRFATGGCSASSMRRPAAGTQLAGDRPAKPDRSPGGGLRRSLCPPHPPPVGRRHISVLSVRRRRRGSRRWRPRDRVAHRDQCAAAGDGRGRARPRP